MTSFRAHEPYPLMKEKNGLKTEAATSIVATPCTRIQVQNEMFLPAKTRSEKITFTGPEHHFLEPRKSVFGA